MYKRVKQRGRREGTMKTDANPVYATYQTCSDPVAEVCHLIINVLDQIPIGWGFECLLRRSVRGREVENHWQQFLLRVKLMKYQNNEEMKLRKKLLMLGLVERESTLICMNFCPRPCPYLGWQWSRLLEVRMALKESNGGSWKEQDGRVAFEIANSQSSLPRLHNRIHESYSLQTTT